jgi:putative tryptophan/tyrosine transport system substrate-binding protein
MRLITQVVGLVLSFGLAFAPLAGEAQGPARVARIGYLVLSPLVDPPSAERQAFLDGLRELGYVVGQNIVIEYRSANWNRELLPDLAQELVELKVDVIMAVPGTTDAARQATRTIPIVIASGTDPVASGLVPSLARPGGNITGMTFAPAEMAGKRMALLKETFPKLARLAVLWNPENDGAQLEWQDTQSAACVLAYIWRWTVPAVAVIAILATVMLIAGPRLGQASHRLHQLTTTRTGPTLTS